LQEELRLKDRMAAVGEMAAGLAHEIGNPLAAISGSVQMLHSGASENQRQKLLEIVLRESDRLDRTVKDFLRFARPRPPAPVPFDVARLLSDETALLRNSRELVASHELALELNPASAQIVADADQISQVFWNLVRNALKAMPHGGALTIRGTLETSWYTIEVADTGMGMGEDQQRRIFQPFTSFFDQGSGVGMAIVYRIIEEHRGRLGVVSSPGAGTTIRITLPVTQPEHTS
jgi:two-component system sensor histidine kinase PilS (NtrC family)